MEALHPQSIRNDVARERDALPTRRSLLSRLRNLADDASWRTFFDSYWRLIYSVARKSGLTDEDSQDVVQDTVIAVARKMPEFRYDPAKGSFKRWLLRITQRRIHDRLRRFYQSPRFQELDSEHETAEPALAPDALMDAAWEEEWQKNLFQAALSRVRQGANPKHFQVFDYCFLQSLPAGDVAQRLGLTSAQVYLAKHRMTLAVKRAVKELGAEMERAPAR